MCRWGGKQRLVAADKCSSSFMESYDDLNRKMTYGEKKEVEVPQMGTNEDKMRTPTVSDMHTH